MQNPPNIVAAVPELPDEELKRKQLETMKFRATGLLVLAAVIFVVARVFEQTYPWVGYVRATAEAAMVGAMADWFAVTALFRHPLGIPIPHTAIIPNRKDRIGRSLGNFVQNNFLAAADLRAAARRRHRRARGAVAGRAGARARRGHARRGRGGRRGAGAATTRTCRSIIEQSVQSACARRRSAPLLGSVLSLVTPRTATRSCWTSPCAWSGGCWRRTGRRCARGSRQETPWWMPTPVDEQDLPEDRRRHREHAARGGRHPDHPLRQRFDEAVTEFVERLRVDPEMIARGEALKEELLRRTRRCAATRPRSGRTLKESLLRHGADPDSEFRRRIEHAVVTFGDALGEDRELLEKVNGWAESAALYVVEQYRHEAGDLIAATVQRVGRATTPRARSSCRSAGTCSSSASTARWSVGWWGC